jgi:1-deoxy-D-xylulose-5-phosphate synthase
MEKITPGKLLAQVQYPHHLRNIPEEQLLDFCAELRQYIIEHCSIHGGHFGGSLGVVELTTALHYVFNTPYDRLVWDVGHQAYGHKIITGRRDRFHTNRLYKGISGFPKRSESEYDTFGVGHSSTSISAALGMSIASKLKGETDRHAIAVIGDGALTGGMAFEALNNAGSEKADLLVVLNDNCMSIDGNVGAMKEYLTDLTSSRTYNKLRNDLWNFLDKWKSARNYAARLEDAFMATFFKPGLLFESLGFRYFGPIDGHDVNHLVRILRDLKEIKGPKLLHCVTVKGKGFAPAEKDQTKWHAPSFNFDTVTGEALAIKKADNKPAPPKYQDVFGETAIELMKANEKIVAVTPAMLSGSGMVKLKQLIPDRTFDVGICEQHAVTFSAGMATEGLIPFCNIYSTFLQRGFDQVVHDVAIQNLKVIFCLDRGGLVGADGATHHGVYDLAYLRILPNMIVSAPMNEQEMRNLMFTAVSDDVQQPMSIRYPRGNGVMLDWKTPFEKIVIGKGRALVEGSQIAFLTIGAIGNLTTKALERLAENDIQAGHYDMRFVKPLDEELLHHICQKYSYLITVEDGCIQGGFGSAVLEFMADHGYTNRIIRLGVPDKVVHQGTQAELYAECGYDADAMVRTALQLIGQKVIA